MVQLTALPTMPGPLPVVPLRTIALDAELVRLAGDGNAALFLRQALFWQRLHQRPFYKFNAPAPNHPAYHSGDSWQEETGLTRSQFERARRRLAVKVQGSDPAQIKAAFAGGALLVCWTTEEHLTWYRLNEAALRERAPELCERLLGTDTSADESAPDDPVRIPAGRETSAAALEKRDEIIRAQRVAGSRPTRQRALRRLRPRCALLFGPRFPLAPATWWRGRRH
ncbi:MAG: hypothetical protein H0T73_15065, partial [Ardenticatenales bacterium]|nr:hypothetical protein [Ardenticatenales bacterium]